MPPRIMYIERKAGNIWGTARIGRVTFSRTGKLIYYQGKRFARLYPRGYKANYFEMETGEEYWISGCKKAGGDRLYAGTIEIDDDVRVEYWCDIRKLPQRQTDRTIRCIGKYAV